MIGTKNKTAHTLTATIKQNLSFMLPFLLFMLTGGLLQLISSKREIFLFVNSHYHTYTDWFFRYFTHVGDGLFCVLVIVALLFVSYGYALVAGVTFGLSALTSVVLKRLVFPGTFRPRKYFESEPGLLRFIDGLEVHTANSFPSGHTITAFAILSILAFMIKDKRWGILLFVMALLAAFSRMYLAQHFFEDVYWGAAIGVGSSVLTWYLLIDRSSLPDREWWTKSLLRR